MKKAVFTILLLSIALVLFCYFSLKKEIFHPLSGQEHLSQAEEIIYADNSSTSPDQPVNPFSLQIRPDMQLSIHDPQLATFLSELILDDIILYPEDPLSNHKILKLFSRAMPIAYSKELIASWENESKTGYTVPVQAVEAVMDALLLSSDISLLYRFNLYDPTNDTVYIEKERFDPKISSAIAVNTGLYPYATSKLLFESQSVEYTDNEVYELNLNFSFNDVQLYRLVQVCIIDSSVRIATVVVNPIP